MSTETVGEDGFFLEQPVDKTVTITPIDVQEALDAVSADIPVKDDPSFFGQNPMADVALKAFGGSPKREDISAASVEHVTNALAGQLEQSPATQQYWFTPEEFAKRVEDTKQYVLGLQNVDKARSAEVIRRVAKVVRENITNSEPFETRSKHPSESLADQHKRNIAAMSDLRARLNKIHFTEEEALIAGNLLSGHAMWKIWYENGEWKVIETKEKNPQAFVTGFRHASAAMKMNSLLNMGRSNVDPDVLAVIGACKRLDDIVDSLPDDQRAEYIALMNFLNQMPSS